jgi:hypothetical protein
VDQSGGLKGVSGRFIGQLVRRELAQLFINQWQQLIGCIGIRIADRVRQVGRFT